MQDIDRLAARHDRAWLIVSNPREIDGRNQRTILIEQADRLGRRLDEVVRPRARAYL
ncbi:MAG: hypothetical protein R3195_19400 [Gemmatimonadota bacterium]|nr:hypothetical protein [Gemmatimonadota bacterium]